MKTIQLGSIKAIYGDCMDYMKTLQDGAYDLAIVDPPYGIGASKPTKKPDMVKQKNGQFLKVNNRNYKHKDWDLTPPSRNYFEELFRVSKRQIIFGVNYFISLYPDLFLSSGRLVWDKLNGDSDQMGCEIAYVSINNRTDIVYCKWHGMIQGKVCSTNIDEAIYQQGNKKLNQKRIHPTEKPVALYEWMLQRYAECGWKIVDTHGGSKSHAIACHNLGFELDIIEKDYEIFNEAITRLEWHRKQKLLFAPADFLSDTQQQLFT